MRDTPCDVIRDLLALYVDGVCSDESRALVEAHRESCPECAAVEASMRNAVPAPAQEEDISIAQALKSLRKHMTRKRIVTVGLITILIVALIVLTPMAYQELCLMHKVDIPASQLDSYELSITSEGQILYFIDAHSVTKAWGRSTTMDKEKGDLYIAATRPIIDLSLSTGGDEPWPYALDTGVYLLEDGRAYLDSEHGAPGLGQDGTAYVFDDGALSSAHEVKRILIGSLEDHVLLWERGVVLPPATSQDEAWNKPSYDVEAG